MGILFRRVTLKEEQAEAGKKKKLAENYEQWLKDMDAFLSGNSDRIQIQFQSGTVMEQKIGNE